MNRKVSYVAVIATLLVSILYSCGDTKNQDKVDEIGEIEIAAPIIVKEYGYPVDEYIVYRDTVKAGDSFGQILFENNVDYPTIQAITDTAKNVFDTRRIQVGKPYTLFKKKDSLESAAVFVYEKNKEDYIVLDWNTEDTIQAALKTKPIIVTEREASGLINSNLSSTFDDLGVNVLVAYKMADIYAWTIDFFKLQKGDRFKVIYEERFVDDTISTGIGKIKACVFEHAGREIYAYRFANDSLPGDFDYFDENGDNLRRAFLKGPLKFNRISSRYNLKRRIKYYGYKLRPHRGTDFAGAIGTPILATADGVVTKSERRGGNGNYVKIRHNGTYETQYLHMQRRNVKVGQTVRQGDIIGTIGMTGNTGGPHVCYRFWKNGKEVDPFKQDLPDSEPLTKDVLDLFLEFKKPWGLRLDDMNYPDEETDESAALQDGTTLN